MTAEQIESYHLGNHGPWPVQECSPCQRAKTICVNKIRYFTPQLATAVARTVNELRAYGRPQAPYHCRWCDCWHTTSRMGKIRRGRIERQRRRWLTRLELERRSAVC